MLLNELIKQYDRIFIDASTLLSHSGQFMLNEFSKYDVLDFNGANHIIITNESIFKVTDDPGTTKVNYLIKTLKNLNESKVLQFKNFGNESYQTIFDKFLQRYSLALIVNDKKIANEMLGHKFISNSKKLGIYSLNSKVQLDSYFASSAFNSSNSEAHYSNATKNAKFNDVIETHGVSKNIITVEKKVQEDIYIETADTNEEVLGTPFSKKYLEKPVKFKGIEKHDTLLNHELPSLHDKLETSSSQSIELISILSEKGGEGIVYYTNLKGYVCKIYRKTTLTKHKLEKLELLISKPINDSRIAYPKDIVFYKGKFVGYIMPYVKGFFVGDLFYGKLSATNRIKTWSRLDLINLCISILTLTKKIHDHGILIGDVNRNNFMIASPLEVYMVDVDSVQVEKYPCPVGVEEFTPPEIIDGEFSYKEFFRTYENEYYSISILLFMILTLGVQITSQISQKSTNSLTKIQKIKLQNFGFTLDEKDCVNKQTPINYAIWSRFPSYIKESFYHTFHKSGKYNKPKSRLTIERWLEIMKSYRYHFTTGALSQDMNHFNDLISTSPVSFKSVRLEQTKIQMINICEFDFDKLIEFIRLKSKALRYKNIDTIIEAFYKDGFINNDLIKLKLTKNFGFMYEVKGQIYIN